MKKVDIKFDATDPFKTEEICHLQFGKSDKRRFERMVEWTRTGTPFGYIESYPDRDVIRVEWDFSKENLIARIKSVTKIENNLLVVNTAEKKIFAQRTEEESKLFVRLYDLDRALKVFYKDPIEGWKELRKQAQRMILDIPFDEGRQQ